VPGVSDGGSYGDQFARASALLVRHHSHDPDAVRIGLGLSNLLSFRRDAILLGFVASAEGREAEGLARMSLAQYLKLKADAAEGSRKVEGRRNVTALGRGDDGRVTARSSPQSDEEFAYSLHLRQCDPEYLRAEVERLFEEVIANYADIPYLTHRVRTWQDDLTQRSESGDPITEEEQQRLDTYRSKTLGSVAAEQLDEIRNVSRGRVVPEIEGETLDGNPMALSDHRGKVDLLVFWRAGDRPEAITNLVTDLGGIPDRFEGRPFAMLGVNCDPNPEDAAHAIETGPIPWPNWYDPASEDDSLTGRYHVDRFPTLFLIDDDGVLRHRIPFPYPEDRLAQAIETLLENVESGDDDRP
jgi:peroxiredoxin